jgi:ribonuclease HI
VPSTLSPKAETIWQVRSACTTARVSRELFCPAPPVNLRVTAWLANWADSHTPVVTPRTIIHEPAGVAANDSRNNESTTPLHTVAATSFADHAPTGPWPTRAPDSGAQSTRLAAANKWCSLARPHPAAVRRHRLAISCHTQHRFITGVSQQATQLSDKEHLACGTQIRLLFSTGPSVTAKQVSDSLAPGTAKAYPEPGGKIKVRVEARHQGAVHANETACKIAVQLLSQRPATSAVGGEPRPPLCTDIAAVQYKREGQTSEDQIVRCVLCNWPAITWCANGRRATNASRPAYDNAQSGLPAQVTARGACGFNRCRTSIRLTRLKKNTITPCTDQQALGHSGLSPNPWPPRGVFTVKAHKDVPRYGTFPNTIQGDISRLSPDTLTPGGKRKARKAVAGQLASSARNMQLQLVSHHKGTMSELGYAKLECIRKVQPWVKHLIDAPQLAHHKSTACDSHYIPAARATTDNGTLPATSLARLQGTTRVGASFPYTATIITSIDTRCGSTPRRRHSARMTTWRCPQPRGTLLRTAAELRNGRHGTPSAYHSASPQPKRDGGLAAGPVAPTAPIAPSPCDFQWPHIMPHDRSTTAPAAAVIHVPGPPVVWHISHGTQCVIIAAHVLRVMVLMLLTMSGDVEPNPGPVLASTAVRDTAQVLYWEPQHENFCLVFAINAFAGRPVLDGAQLFAYGSFFQQLLMRSGDVEPNPGPPRPERAAVGPADPLQGLDIYIESQCERLCLVHSFNAFVGRAVLEGQQLIDYCNLFKHAFENGTFLHYAGAYSDTPGRRGDFNQLVLDHWLYHGCGIDACFCPAGSLPKAMHWREKQRIVNSNNRTEYLLGWGENYGDDFGHMVAVKWHGGTWFIIDSMHPAPIPLNNEDNWKCLRGDLYALCAGNAYKHRRLPLHLLESPANISTDPAPTQTAMDVLALDNLSYDHYMMTRKLESMIRANEERPWAPPPTAHIDITSSEGTGHHYAEDSPMGAHQTNPTERNRKENSPAYNREHSDASKGQQRTRHQGTEITQVTRSIPAAPYPNAIQKQIPGQQQEDRNIKISRVLTQRTVAAANTKNPQTQKRAATKKQGAHKQQQVQKRMQAFMDGWLHNKSTVGHGTKKGGNCSEGCAPTQFDNKDNTCSGSCGTAPIQTEGHTEKWKEVAGAPTAGPTSAKTEALGTEESPPPAEMGAPPAAFPRRPTADSTGGAMSIEGQHLKVLTLNTLGTGDRAIADLQTLNIGADGSSIKPNVVVLTDTQKARAQNRTYWLRKTLRPYALFFSSTAQGGAGQGVVVGVPRHWKDQGIVLNNPLPEDLQGRVLHLTISEPGRPTWHILGVYMSPSQTVPQRHLMYSLLHKHVLKRANLLGDLVILAGDWNAALFPTDRASHRLTSQDKEHGRFVRDAGLKQVPGPRGKTFHGVETSSRIDDILWMPGRGHKGGRNQHSERVIKPEGCLFDHDPLEATLCAGELGIVLPVEAPTGQARTVTKLKLPIPKEAAEQTRQRVEHDLANPIYILGAQISKYLVEEVRPHMDGLSDKDARGVHKLQTLGDRPAKTVIEELAIPLVDLLHKAQDIMLDTCPTTTRTIGGIRYRPAPVKRQRMRLISESRMLGLLAKQMMTNPEETDLTHAVDNWARHAANREGVPAGSDTREEIHALTNDADLTPAEQAEYLRDMQSKARADVRRIDRLHAKESIQKDVQRRRRELDENQRQASRTILIPTMDERPRGGLTTVIGKGGLPTADPEEVKATIEDYYREKQNAPSGLKTGKYLPEEAERRYPFTAKGTTDGFKLETLATQGPRAFLQHSVQDKIMFMACIDTLSNGKAPGPDGVVNEVLKHLPIKVKEIIHDLFTLMWATGITPNDWKESNTVLLYKNKGSPLELKYYRPIALANTLYKLWTRMVTFVLNDFAEKNRVLSRMQAGFRNKNRTTDQLQMVVQALQDAHLNSQDIYTMLIDFSSAFNTINHDKLLMVMYDLGFPTDAIEVVRDLYTNATTTFCTPYGATAQVPVDRGTLQGDSLSPFLFLIYMEPLLRWIHYGGRGYQFGALTGEDRAKHHLSSVAFADDLTMFCANIPDLHAQADKLSQYADWADLEVNTGKTSVTGALHSMAASAGKYGAKDPWDDTVLMRQLLGRIQVQGQAVDYQSPKQPFKLLGVQITMNLDWRPQFEDTAKTIREKVQRIAQSWAAPAQKVRLIESCLRPAITYALPVAPYTATQIHSLDRLLLSGVKKAWGQRHSMPSALAHEDRERFGLGCHSLMVEYAHISTQTLVRALRHQGTMGVVSRAVLEQQRRWVANCMETDMPRLVKYAIRVRQLSLMQGAGVHLLKDMQEYATLTGTPLIRAVLKAQEDADQHWSKLFPAQHLQPLNELGVEHIEQVLEPNGRRVISPEDLARNFTGVKARHKKAIARLAAILSADPMQPPPALADVTLKPSAVERTLHQVYLDEIQADPPPGDRGRPAARIPLARITTYFDKKERKPPEPMPEAAANSLREAQALERAREADRDKELPGDLQPNITRKRQRNKSTRRDPVKGHRSTINARETPNYSADTRLGRHKQALRHWGEDRVRAAQESVALAHPHQHFYFDRILHWCMKSGQSQFMVKWAGCFMEKWVIEQYIALGYELDGEPEEEAEPHSDEHTHPYDAPCEVCCSAEVEDEGPRQMILCDGCGRGWHLGCLRPAMHSVPGGEWYCHECTAHLAQEGQTEETLRTAQHVQHSKICWVNFQPKEEPEEQLRSDGHNAEVEAYWEEAQCPLPREAEKRPDEIFANLVRQGADEAPAYDKTIGDALRNKLILPKGLNPTHPQLDGIPTGRYEVSIETVDQFRRKKGPRKGLRNYEPAPAVKMAVVRDPHGGFVGTLTLDRLAILHRALHDTQAARPELASKLEVGSFATELALLLRRYRTGARIQGGREVKMDNHWAVEAGVMRALQDFLGLEKERYASPLNYNPELQEYCAVHERDQVFGARWDAHKWWWTGSSEANPEYEHADMNAAMRWAVHSALRDSTIPVLTLLILPAWDERSSTSYLKWLKHCEGVATPLMRIPRKKFKFVKPTQWQDACALAGHPKWDVNLVLVANAAGYEMYCKAQSEEHTRMFQAHLARALSNLLDARVKADEVRQWWKLPADWKPHDDRARLQLQGCATELGLKCPRALRKALADTRCRPAVDTQDPTPLLDEWQLALTYPQVGRPRLNWKEGAYTDGSLTKEGRGASAITRTGAAVYFPDRKTGTDGRTTKINPGPSGYTNTINRAELVAIKQYLEETRDCQQHRWVATDSATAIRMISKAVTSPQDLTEHKHRELLEDIIEALRKRKYPLVIYKVKSHTGITGNEIADQAAKLAATSPDTSVNVGAEPHREGYWAATRGTNAGDSGEENSATGGIRQLSNLTDHLKAVCHKRHRQGAAKTEGIYAESWAATAKDVLLDISNYFWKSSKVRRAEREKTLQYRYGGLYTQLMAYRFGHATSPDCLLCGELDGGHHALSGCKAMERAVTERHNGAGRILIRHISEGQHGAGLIQADVGTGSKLERGGISAAGHTIPRRLLPKGWTEEQIKTAQTRCKPDAIVEIRGEKGQPSIHLVEIKYCRDTDRSQQEARAGQQHTELQKHVEAAGYTVRRHTILLGVGGTIYKDTLATLENLGVGKREAKAALQEVHVYSVQQVLRVLKIRRMKEAERRRETGTRAAAMTTGRPTQGPQGRRWQWRRQQPQPPQKKPQAASQRSAAQRQQGVEGGREGHAKRKRGGGEGEGADRPGRRQRRDALKTAGATAGAAKTEAGAAGMGAAGPGARRPGEAAAAARMAVEAPRPKTSTQPSMTRLNGKRRHRQTIEGSSNHRKRKKV